jgi:hypothetical protein
MANGLVFLDIFVCGLIFTAVGSLVVGICAPVLARFLNLPALASEWMILLFILAVFLWPLAILPLAALPFTARKDVSFSDIFNV